MSHELTERQELARAVRRVAHARGRIDTRIALLRLIGFCEAWADRLAETGEDHPHQDRAA